jgi:hypothetical protein
VFVPSGYGEMPEMSFVAFFIATLLAHIGLGGPLAVVHQPATAAQSHSSHSVRPQDSGGGMPFTQGAPAPNPTLQPVTPQDSGGGMPFQ